MDRSDDSREYDDRDGERAGAGDAARERTHWIAGAVEHGAARALRIARTACAQVEPADRGERGDHQRVLEPEHAEQRDEAKADAQRDREGAPDPRAPGHGPRLAVLE